jgi:hypothetical protein
MVSLNDVCYEQIKDNFYYGLFGDFKLVIDKTTGCFNATKLCNDANKRYRNWARTERSIKLINYYKSCRSLMSGNFYEVRESNNDELNKQITGQYVQKELILDIASWISVEFYDKCNQIIINYFVGEFKSMDKNEFEAKIKDIEERMSDIILEKEDIIQEKNDKIDELLQLGRQQEERSKRQEEMLRSLGVHLEDVACQNNELLEKVDDQNEKLDVIQNKLDIAVEDRAPQPKKTNKRERFILLKRNDPDFKYYTIRAQDVNARIAIKRQRTLFTEVEILMDIHCHPNSKTLYVRVKEDLKEKGVIFNLCKISLEESPITEEQLIQAMQIINDEKLVV